MVSDSLEKSLKLSDLSIEYAQKYNFKEFMPGPLNIIANNFMINGEYDKALEKLEMAQKISNEIGDFDFETKNNKAQIYFMIGKITKAKNLWEEIYKFSKNNNIPPYELSALIGLGKTEYFIGNINKAQENILQALDISNKYNLLDIQQVCKCVLGEIYKEQGKFEQAIKLLDESLSNLIYKMNEMACLVSLVETKKMAGYIYNSELDRLTDIVLKANYITFIENYQLFLVLEDTPYLETAYNQVQEKASAMEEELNAKFLELKIPKAIVEEWEKVK